MQLGSGDRRVLSVTPWPAGGQQGYGDALVEVHAIGKLSQLSTVFPYARAFSPLREAIPVCCLLQASPLVPWLVLRPLLVITYQALKQLGGFS